MKKVVLAIATSLTVGMLSPISLVAQELSGNTIKLTGKGEVSASADIAHINIRVSAVNPTLKKAQSQVAVSMAQVLDMLKQEKVSESDIKTTWINYSEEYDYKENERMLTGQRATQSISVVVRRLSNNATSLSTILDKLVGISNVSLESVSFGIEKKDALYKKSRELAFKKAEDTAKQYAELAGRRLGKVISISEGYSQDAYTGFLRSVGSSDAMMESSVAYKGVSSSVPTGEETISTQVTVVFSLE